MRTDNTFDHLLSTIGLASVLLFASTVPGEKIEIINAVASSVQDNHAQYSVDQLKPGMAIDGNETTTRWASQWYDPQWIYFDLGSPKTFNHITIFWETAYGESYEIQVSDDAENWKTIFEERDGDGGVDVAGFSAQSARYIRLYGVGRGTQFGYSILEFKVENKLEKEIKKKPYGKKGLYIMMNGTYDMVIGPDFNGLVTLTSLTDTFAIPDIKSSIGFNVVLGLRFSALALESSYGRSMHNVSIGGTNGEAIQNSVHLDIKYYFLDTTRTQPYLLMGIGSHWLTVKRASEAIFSPGKIGDAVYYGTGLNLGAGFAYLPHPSISISAGIIYRLIRYQSISGVLTEGGALPENLDGSRIHFNLGASFTI